MAIKKYPKIPSTAPSEQKIAKSSVPDYDTNIAWHLNLFDYESRWGLLSVLGNLSFKPSKELEEAILNYDDEELYKIMDGITGKEFISFDALLCKIANCYNKPISHEILKNIAKSCSKNFFIQKIYPKLLHFEGKTWNEIDKEKYGKEGKSKHHFINVDHLIKEAQVRLQELKLTDYDQVFSLRLDGELRLYGIRESNIFKILWVDTKHEICPSNKKHT